jgi:hypothetical protein
MSTFDPSRDKFGDDSGISNEERRNRVAEYNRRRGLGAENAPAPLSGDEQARENTLLNLRHQLAAAEKSLEGFANRHGNSKEAYRAYLYCHNRTGELMRTLATMTGQKFRFHEALPDPFEVDPFDIGPDTPKQKLDLSKFSGAYGK